MRDGVHAGAGSGTGPHMTTTPIDPGTGDPDVVPSTEPGTLPPPMPGEDPGVPPDTEPAPAGV